MSSRVKRPLPVHDGLHPYVAAALLLVAAGPAAGETEVPLWGLFETTIDYEQETNDSHSYSDPFYGIDLDATFVAPSGREVSWFGFFDGDGQGGQSGDIWKLRFMPDELGEWSYTWSFADGSASGSGTFRSVHTVHMPRKPGPLRHDPNIRQWLVSADGSQHVFTNMYSNSDEDPYGDRNPYVEPFEAILAVLATGAQIFSSNHTHWFDHNDPDLDPSIYLDTSSFRPRMHGWQMLERLYDIAYEQGVWVYEWDGFYSGNGLLDLHLAPQGLQDDVIKYILARSSPYYNVIFNIGFELCDYSNVPDWPVQRAEFVRSIDPWHTLIAAHQCNHEWYQYPDDEIISMSALQVNDSFHERALDVWNSPAEPNPHLSEGIWNAPWQEAGTEESHRHDLWESITGGMSVFFWPIDNYIGYESFRHANTFLRAGTPWWTMTPRDDLVASGGARVLANPGQAYIVYDASGSSFELELDAGTYEYRWFDPVTGWLGGWDTATLSSGVHTVTKPGSDHWVLDIRREPEAIETPNVGGPVTPPGNRVVLLSPNPFAFRTTVHLEVTTPGRAEVDVYGVDGRRVRRLMDRELGAGSHTVAWDARGDDGSPVAAGTYFIRMRTAEGVSTERALVLH